MSWAWTFSWQMTRSSLYIMFCCNRGICNFAIYCAFLSSASQLIIFLLSLINDFYTKYCRNQFWGSKWQNRLPRMKYEIYVKSSGKRHLYLQMHNMTSVMRYWLKIEEENVIYIYIYISTFNQKNLSSEIDPVVCQWIMKNEN